VYTDVGVTMFATDAGARLEAFYPPYPDAPYSLAHLLTHTADELPRRNSGMREKTFRHNSCPRRFS
jgi:hypothetical protein